MASERRPAPAPAAPPSGQQGEEAAGAEFFRRRLQRAMAIPPEQRDPAVHAFVTSVQLMSAADALLPLTADGQPALPADTLAGQQAEVQAVALAVTATYTACLAPQWEGKAQSRLRRYLDRRMRLADASSLEAAYLPALQPLATALALFLTGNLPADALVAINLYKLALNKLVPPSTIARQLQQVQRACEHRLLTVDQLEAAFCARIAERAYEALVGSGGTAGQRLPASAASAISTAALHASELPLDLEPSNPKHLLTAGAGFRACMPPDLGEQTRPGQPAMPAHVQQLVQRSSDVHMHAWHAAQAMRSQYWMVRSLANALSFAALPVVAISHADLEALVAAAEQAPAAVKQPRGTLPLAMAISMENCAKSAALALPAVRQRLQGSEPVSQALTALEACHAIRSQQARANLCSLCSGCGKEAIGLRRCARCKQTAYCSRECQLRHWHRRECATPSSAGGT